MTGHFPMQLGAINNLCVKKGMEVSRCVKVMNSWDLAGRLCFCASSICGVGVDVLIRAHSGPGGVSARLLRHCCDFHHVRPAALTGRMAFQSQGNHGSNCRDFDGQDGMFAHEWISRWHDDKGELLLSCSVRVKVFFNYVFYLLSLCGSLWSHCRLLLHLINTSSRLTRWL